MAENINEYVKAAKKGEQQAFSKLFELTNQSAYYTALKITKKQQDAEVYECPDCLQRKMVYTKALPCTAHKYKTTTTKATTKKNGSVVTKCSVCNKKQSSTTSLFRKCKRYI